MTKFQTQLIQMPDLNNGANSSLQAAQNMGHPSAIMAAGPLPSGATSGAAPTGGKRSASR